MLSTSPPQTTRQWHTAIEDSGFQFCKARGGFALFDADDRQEIPGTWAATTGDAVWLAVDKLDLKVKMK